MNPQEPVNDQLKWAAPHADERDVTSEIATPDSPAPRAPSDEVEAAMARLIDHLVDQVPGVLGAVVSSVDGFVLAHRLHATAGADAPGVAAMSAATLALSNRMVQLTGPAAAEATHQRSVDGQVFVFAIDRFAVLTIITSPNADAVQIDQVGREITTGLHRVFAGKSS